MPYAYPGHCAIYFIYFPVFFFFHLETGSLYVAHYADQATLKLTDPPAFPSARIKSLCHHAQLHFGCRQCSKVQICEVSSWHHSLPWWDHPWELLAIEQVGPHLSIPPFLPVWFQLQTGEKMGACSLQWLQCAPNKGNNVTPCSVKVSHKINELAINESHSIGQAVFPSKGRSGHGKLIKL